MNLSGIFQQSPVEVKRYLLDYTAQLASGETVTGVAVNITSPTDLTNDGGCTVNGVAIAPAGNQVVFYVTFTNPPQADLNQYNVQFLASTSIEQTFEDIVQFNVKDKVDN